MIVGSLILISSLLYLAANILDHFTHRDTQDKRLLRNIEILLKLQQLSEEDRAEVLKKHGPKERPRP